MWAFATSISGPPGPPRTLNDELGFAFMASLSLLLVCSVCFALALVPFPLSIDIVVFDI